jgi:hypothetical protein
MKTTPQVSAGFAQTAWVAYGMSRRGALAIRRDDRADAGRRTTRVACTRSTRRRRRPRHAYLVRRTGRIAGWREWRRNCARANRYSQEERVTSRHGPYAECYAMSNVIGSTSASSSVPVGAALRGGCELGAAALGGFPRPQCAMPNSVDSAILMTWWPVCPGCPELLLPPP